MINANELHKISNEVKISDISHLDHDIVEDQLISIEHLAREQAYQGYFKVTVIIKTSPRLLHILLKLNYTLLEYSPNKITISW